MSALPNSGKITLYRGDFDRIDEFKFKKTNSSCLFGKGIYLTDKVAVANSYRTKGGSVQASYYLFEATAPDKSVALAGAKASMLKIYTDHVARSIHTQEYPDRSFYTTLFKYPNYVENLNLHYLGRPVSKWKSEDMYDKEFEAGRIKFIREQNYHKSVTPETKWRFVVVWTPEKVPGYLTVFEFDERTLNSRVWNVDDDPVPLEMYQRMLTLGICRPYRGYEDYMDTALLPNKKDRFNTNTLLGLQPPGQGNPFVKNKANYGLIPQPWNRIAAMLKPQGYLGFEYPGGLMVGGLGRHRAFVLWDETLVNDHKVLRRR